VIKDCHSEYATFTSGGLDWAIENFSNNAKLQPELVAFLQSCDLELDANIADFVTVRAGKRLVAPAEPARFHAEDDVPMAALAVPSVLVASHTDPFMSLARAEYWAGVWGRALIDFGEAGHINVDSGFGSWHYGQVVLCELIEKVDSDQSKKLPIN